MIPKGLFTQLALLLLGVGIVITYIRPAFTEISNTQEQIATYIDERGKVESVNTTLFNRLNTIDSIFDADRDRLLTYMPDSVDSIAVMRDIETIAERTGVVVVNIADNGPLKRERSRGRNIYAVASDDESVMGPHAYSFSTNVRGSYRQIKDLLAELGKNHYPLEVRLLDMRSEEGGFILADMNLFTYSNMPMDVETDIFSDVNVIYE